MTITNVFIIVTQFIPEYIFTVVVTALLVIIPMMFIKDEIR
jgi:hypothetical protein